MTRVRRPPFPGPLRVHAGSQAVPRPGGQRRDGAEWQCDLRIALSEFVFAKDKSLSVTLGRRALTRKARSPARPPSCQSPINPPASTKRSVAKWSWPPFWRITTNTYQLRAVAFHGDARNGRPVRAVKFWAVDENGRTNSPVTVLNRRLITRWGRRPGG